jgi:hypothetical protein
LPFVCTQQKAAAGQFAAPLQARAVPPPPPPSRTQPASPTMHPYAAMPPPKRSTQHVSAGIVHVVAPHEMLVVVPPGPASGGFTPPSFPPPPSPEEPLEPEVPLEPDDPDDPLEPGGGRKPELVAVIDPSPPPSDPSSVAVLLPHPTHKAMATLPPPTTSTTR